MPTLTTGQQPACTSPTVVMYTPAVSTTTAQWAETSTTTSTAVVWQLAWYYYSTGDTQLPEPESREELQRRRNQRFREIEEARHWGSEQQDRYRAACIRARETLRELLDEENQRRLDAGEDLLVVGSAGGQYWLEYRYAGNVKRNGRRYCAHPRITSPEGDYLPTDDVLITQILMLQTNEQRFLQIANVS